jgi:hypothetical protein
MNIRHTFFSSLSLRVLVAALLALIAALALLYSSLFVASRTVVPVGGAGERSAAERLSILESLESGSAVSADEKRETLSSMHVDDTGLSQQQKLDILHGLGNR